MPRPIAIIHQTGASTSFQDEGRTGMRRFGIAPAGSMDPISAALANDLVGNSPDATLIEIGPGGVSIELLQPTWLALVGAGDASPLLPQNSAAELDAGTRLTIRPTGSGNWSYLAIPSGWEAENVFGSSSRHERSKLGSAIESGQHLYANSSPKNRFPNIGRRRPFINKDEHVEPIRILPGPHLSQCATTTFELFLSSEWQIPANAYDRTGYRLEGNALPRPKSINSSPMILGAVQLPPSGQPIVTMNDGPTVGGYPVFAVIHPEDIATLAQTLPNSPISFRSDESATT